MLICRHLSQTLKLPKIEKMKSLMTFLVLVSLSVNAGPQHRFCSVPEETNWEFLKEIKEKYVLAGNLLIFLDAYEVKGENFGEKFAYEPLHCNPDHHTNLSFDQLIPMPMIEIVSRQSAVYSRII